MKKMLRNQLLMAAVVAMAAGSCFAQDGAALYKTKCAMCHGPSGSPSTSMAKMMHIKPVTDPSMKALSVAQIETAIKGGKGRMRAMSGLTDPQIKAVAAYFKTLK